MPTIQAKMVRKKSGVPASVAGEVDQSAAVPAAGRTLAVFEIFAREKRPISKSELARLLDLPESSASDLLNTIHQLGYLSRTISTRRYYPTSRLLNLATAISEGDPLRAVATEATSALSQATGETCTFGIIDGDACKILAVAQGRHRLRYVVQPGDRVTLHGTSLGKALLGMISPEERSRILRLKPLRRLTAQTLVDPKALEAQVSKQHPLGWYGSIDEGTEGVSSLARGGCIGSEVVAMSIIGPTARIAENKAQYLETLESIAKSVF